MSNLVLWGHHIHDYQQMFALSEKDLNGSILEYGGGPSAVNAEMHAQGKSCISCDPLFTLDKATLTSKTVLVFADMVDKVRAGYAKFTFSSVEGLDALIKQRQEGMRLFFNDYSQGKEEKRYLPLQQVKLPFADFSFDLALCSHYLFGDLENVDEAFHVKVLMELARVAKEVRIFPLIDGMGKPSPFLGPVLLALQQENYGVEVKSIDYPLQPQGNAMLRVWAQLCPL